MCQFNHDGEVPVVDIFSPGVACGNNKTDLGFSGVPPHLVGNRDYSLPALMVTLT